MKSQTTLDWILNVVMGNNCTILLFWREPIVFYLILLCIWRKLDFFWSCISSQKHTKHVHLYCVLQILWILFHFVSVWWNTVCDSVQRLIINRKGNKQQLNGLIPPLTTCLSCAEGATSTFCARLAEASGYSCNIKAFLILLWEYENEFCIVFSARTITLG